jgi:hypothetical protein
MNLVSQRGSRIVVRQVPVLLMLVTLAFSLPLLCYSLFHILRRTDADGVGFCLIFGLLLLWVGFEFVATRERIEVDPERRVLTRKISGVFRRREQSATLLGASAIELEIKPNGRGRKQQYLYLCGGGEKFLLNDPAKMYLNQDKLGRMLSEITGLPYQASNSER